MAVFIYVCAGWYYTNVLPSWHEEVSTYPSRVNSLLVASREGDATPTLEESCASPSHPTFAVSESRPNLSLCVAGHTFPIMVMSYASGIAQWPSYLFHAWHEDNVFLLRRFALLYGLLSLCLTFAFVARLADRTTAACSVLLLAVEPCFLSIHSLLVTFEVTPWIFVSAAVLLLLRRREGATSPPDQWSTRRLVLVALLFGLAILSNIKAVFLIAPLALLALRERRTWRTIRPGQWAWIAGTVALAISPMLINSLIRHSGTIQGETAIRLGNIVRNASPLKLLRELPNLFAFWFDFAHYMSDYRDGPLATVVSFALPAAAWAFCVFQAVQWWRRREASLVAALCGVTLTEFIFVSALLYDQDPPANYTPIPSLMAVALGVSVVEGVRLVARRWQSVWQSPARMALVTGAVLLLPLTTLSWNSFKRPAWGEMEASINAHVERALAQHLEATRSEARLLTVTYNMTGMINALTSAPLSPIAGHVYFQDCYWAQTREKARDCLENHWAKLLRLPGWTPLRVVGPVGRSMTDEPNVAEVVPALISAARRLELTLTQEKEFATPSGAPQLAVFRVEKKDALTAKVSN